ncbi:glycosyltransferase [Paracoccus sp. (in: a-proteobacteria)]|uniref:glycosyltransferase n=1 Tax=Paracoccus sp. TaxID=267 RepID=UPI0026DFDA73|nr:glycosyltransferase [Paracoccus sp. (in: a-proteobacteria)]MDO5648306.1 glycosyltransferase [Paracoccus sp. (in: a-proteobacteria)]
MPQTAPVTIVMATYNGARYIGTQLDSIAAQDDPHWRLIASDDGSTDETPNLLRDFQRRRPDGQVTLIPGPRAGATQNFLHLVAQAPDGPLAFCDQDDQWRPDKLRRAIGWLATQTGPAHYAARTIITDADLQVLTESRHFLRPLSFRNALVQAIMAGNASVFNAGAVALLKRAGPAAQAAGILSHDWWAYQITSGAGAALHHDTTPCLMYRQHGASEVGRNDTAAAMLSRWRQLMAGDYGGWLGQNIAALNGARDLLTPDNRDLLDRFARMTTLPGPAALTAARRMGLYRQTRAGTAALYLAALMGRLRIT